MSLTDRALVVALSAVLGAVGTYTLTRLVLRGAR